MTITIAIAIAALVISGAGLAYTVGLRLIAILRAIFVALHDIARLSEAMNKLTASIERIGTQQGEFLERMHRHEIEIARLNEQVNDLTPLPRRKATG